MGDLYQDTIRREVDYWPNARVEFSMRSRHGQAVLHFGGAKRFVVIPMTPGDKRGALNSVADVRRELTALGASRIVSPRPKRDRVRRAAPPVNRDALAHIERAPVKANPFDALAAMLPVAPETKADPLPWWKRLWQRFAGTPSADPTPPNPEEQA